MSRSRSSSSSSSGYDKFYVENDLIYQLLKLNFLCLTDGIRQIIKEKEGEKKVLQVMMKETITKNVE